MRVPFIARWPHRIKAGIQSSELATTMDVLPTFCSLTGAKLSEKKLDGFDMSSLLFGQEGAKSQYEALFYYRRRQLQAVRMGEWKYHLPLNETHPRWTSASPTGPGRKAKLVNLNEDLQEQKDVAKANPKIVKQMTRLAQQAIETLGNDDEPGSAQRPARTLKSSKQMTLAAPKTQE